MCEWKHSKFEMLMIHIYTNTISFSMGNFSFHRMSEGNPFILFEWWTQSLTEQIGLSSSKNSDAQYNSGKRPKRQSIIDFDKSVRFFSYMCVLWKRNRFKGFQSILLLFSNWECYPIADESIFRVLSIQRNHLFQVQIYNPIFRELFCLDVYVMNFFWISNKVWASQIIANNIQSITKSVLNTQCKTCTLTQTCCHVHAQLIHTRIFTQTRSKVT